MLAALAQFLVVVLIARELGPQGNGFYAMALLVPTMLANFLNLGVGSATVYHISRGDFDFRQALSGNLRLAFVVTVAGILIAWPLLTIWGDQLFPGIPRGLLYLGLISFPLILLHAYLNTIFQGLEDFRAFNLTILVPPFVNLAGVAIALYILQLGVVGAMIAYIGGQIVGLLTVIALLRRIREGQDSRERTGSLSLYARKTLGYGWKAHLSNVLTFVSYRADIFLVNLFLNPTATGLYVIAVQIAEKLWMLSQAVSTVLLPRLSAMHQSPNARLALTNKAFLLVSGLTFLGGVVGAIALYWLLGPIFGEAYLDTFPAFLWLLPGIIAAAGARIYANTIAAAGKPEWNMYVALLAVAINVIGNILLIPDFGIIGAAWATSIAYCADASIKRTLISSSLHD